MLIYNYPLGIWITPIIANVVRVPYGENYGCVEMKHGRVIAGNSPIVGCFLNQAFLQSLNASDGCGIIHIVILSPSQHTCVVVVHHLSPQKLEKAADDATLC